MARFSGRRFLITGGSQGIGLATAQQAAREGAAVCVASRDPSRVEGLHRVVMDVRCDESVAAAVAEARSLLGGLDVVVNNAGYAHPGYVEQMPMSAFEDMLQTNYLGQVRVVRAVLPEFMAERRGHIVNVSSMLGFMGMFGYTAYCGSKYATAGFTECLRQELLPHGIKVSLCYPPTTATPGLERENQHKPPEAWAIEGKSRTFTPEEVAASLLEGIARGRYEILVGFDSSLIWRLQRHVPGLVRRITDGVLFRHLGGRR